MSECITKNFPSSLTYIIEFMKRSKVLLSDSSSATINYLREENNLFADLSVNDIHTLLTYFSNYPVSKSLSDDIENAHQYNRGIERLLYILTILFNKKLIPINETEANQIFKLKENYFIIEEFEVELRHIYNYLLSKHISSSAKTSKRYINYLTRLQDNLKVKYYGVNADSTLETLRVHNITRVMMQQDYLDALIMGVISKLLIITDEMLEEEETYAYAMSYQLLLRSLFLIMNDYERLMMYESIYQGMLKTNIVSHNIIRMAFISYKEDYQNYSTRKKMKIKQDVA